MCCMVLDSLDYIRVSYHLYNMDPFQQPEANEEEIQTVLATVRTKNFIQESQQKLEIVHLLFQAEKVCIGKASLASCKEIHKGLLLAAGSQEEESACPMESKFGL